MVKVLILQRIVPHYRIAFFNALARNLLQRNMTLDLVYGQEAPGQVPKSELLTAPWSTRIRNWYLSIGRLMLVIQPLNPLQLRAYSLVVVEQANSLVFNFLVFLLRPLFGYKVAFWGHGYNRQAECRENLSEKLKQKLLAQADWWFAYTDGTADYLTQQGFDRQHISVVRNSIDTMELINEFESLSKPELDALLNDYDLTGNNIALFCGGLAAGKNLDFLFSAAQKIHDAVPDFELVIAGSGPDEVKVREFAATHQWTRYVGAQYGRKKAAFYRLAKVILMPGPVGLAMIDAIVAGLPLLTTANGRHGPEIDYLSDGFNGYITSMSEDVYAAQAIKLLQSPALLTVLQKNCLSQRNQYGIEQMAANFTLGINRCLGRT
jgi:L-malate glycosyltransferase